MHRLTLMFVAAASLAGCAGTVGTGTVVAAGTYDPDLVYVSPGVSVVADHDEPVFYNDNVYWRYYGGRWYRSSDFNRGWRTYDAPPVAITSIQRPETYRHYRPQGYTVRRDRPATFTGGARSGPVIRDHRR